jgi:hypothetical protein
MAYITTEDRVNRLEALFGQFMTEMALLSRQARERGMPEEERNVAAGERRGRDQEVDRAYLLESREARRAMDKKWGDLANKMGTIIEDILAPNLRRLAREHFHCDPILAFMIRCTRRPVGQNELEGEFDTVVVGSDTVILGEAKSSPSVAYADEFAAKVATFFDFFPEYQGRRFIPVFGSWAIPDRVVDRLTHHRIYALRMGEETMELANAAVLEAGSGLVPAC